MFQASFHSASQEKAVSKEPPLFIFETIYVTCRGFICEYDECVVVRSCSFLLFYVLY